MEELCSNIKVRIITGDKSILIFRDCLRIPILFWLISILIISTFGLEGVKESEIQIRHKRAVC